MLNLVFFSVIWTVTIGEYRLAAEDMPRDAGQAPAIPAVFLDESAIGAFPTAKAGRLDMLKSSQRFSIAIFAAALAPAPACAVTWDEFLNDAQATGLGVFQTARSAVLDQYRRARGVTITACFASDWTALVDRPEITAAWEQETGNHVQYPRDPAKPKLLPGSGTVLADWNGGKTNCDLVAPDVGVVGYRSPQWEMDKTVLVAASFPVAVVPNEVLEPVLKYLNKKSAADLNFTDLVQLAGTPWAKIDPAKAHWGDFRAATTNPSLSGSAAAVVTSLAYEAAGVNKLSGRDVTAPKILDVLTEYKNNVMHDAESTGALTQSFIADPNQYAVIWTYESRIPQIKREMDASFVYSGYVVQADRRIFVSAPTPEKRAAALSFVEYLLGAQAQSVIASDDIALRPSSADVKPGEVVKEFKKLRFNTVRPGRDVVQAVMRQVGKE